MRGWLGEMIVNTASRHGGEPGPDDWPRAGRGRSPAARGAEVAHRRQVAHDIRHELSTIMLLASVLQHCEDLGPGSRARVAQIVAETRWLEELISAYERDPAAGAVTGAASTRLDVVASDILRAIDLSCGARVRLEATDAVSARVDRLEFWRVLRNIICNAIAAVGEGGRVHVHVYAAEGGAIVDVDDDGPGFDPRRTSAASLGLVIVSDLVTRWGGKLSIGRGVLGGCGIRLRFPAAATPAAGRPAALADGTRP